MRLRMVCFGGSNHAWMDEVLHGSRVGCVHSSGSRGRRRPNAEPEKGCICTNIAQQGWRAVSPIMMMVQVISEENPASAKGPPLSLAAQRVMNMSAGLNQPGLPHAAAGDSRAPFPDAALPSFQSSPFDSWHIRGSRAREHEGTYRS